MKAFTLATLMTLAASPVFAFNLSDAANAVSAMQNQQQQGPPQPPQNTHHEEDDRALNKQHRADLQNQNIHGNHRE